MSATARTKFGRMARWTLIGALVPLVGCGLQGRYMGGDLRPEMARDQFELLRPDDMPGRFVEADLRFQQDGTFTAVVNYDGKLETHQGTFKYDQQVGKLTFTDNKGDSYVYGAKKPDDNTLLLLKGIKGSDVTLTLKRQPAQE